MSGKTLSDLNLTSKSLSTPDDREQDWYRFTQAIEDLLATGRATFAEDTLRGIQESVQKYRVVTDGQRRAVKNIEAGMERGLRYRGSRRYEGFR